MSDHLNARTWELADGPWYPLAGLLPRVWEATNLFPSQVSDIIIGEIVAGRVAIRVKGDAVPYHHIASEAAAAIYAKADTFSQIDWKTGTFGEAKSAIDVYWPEVICAVEKLHKPDDEKRSAKAKTGGRPPKYRWEKMKARLMEHLRENGCPSPGDGEQAKLERLVAGWFGENAPAESHIRREVSETIEAFRVFVG